MRIYDIAIFLFIFNLSIGMMNQLNLGIGEKNKIDMLSENEILNYKEDTIRAYNSTSNILTDVTNFVVDSVSFVVKGIPILASVIWDASIGFGPFLNTVIGVPSVIANPIGIIVILIYLIGILQLLIGRNLSEYS